MAVDVMNTTPRKHGKNQLPIEIFSLVGVQPKLQNFHEFGCPVYVKNAPLQRGQLQSKWMSQARLGIYLGMSPRHARTVALVLNPRSGLVSPQWHVKFNDNFDTVSKTSDKTHALWKKQAGFVTILGMKDPESQNLQTTNFLTMANNNFPARFNISGLEGSALPLNSELLPAPPDGATPTQDLGYGINFGDSDNKDQLHNVEFGTSADDNTVALSQDGDALTLRRSNRLRKPSWKVRDSLEYGEIALPAAYKELASYFEPKIANEMMDSIAFLAKLDPDILYYHQAMKAKDAKDFCQAMQGEVNSHCENNHWEIIRRNKVPEGVKVLDSVWEMWRKRCIKTKEGYKWRARLNTHGGQQEYGVNYWETFSPVVTWVSIRLVLVLSILLSWHTCQINFVLAYPQAPIETPL
jgi:hypothetical protein